MTRRSERDSCLPGIGDRPRFVDVGMPRAAFFTWVGKAARHREKSVENTAMAAQFFIF